MLQSCVVQYDSIWFKYKLIKIKQNKKKFLSHTSHIQVLNIHVWLVATVLDSTDIEYLHYQRKFYEWDRFAELVHTPFHFAMSFFPLGDWEEGTKPQLNYLEIFAYEIWIWLSVYVIRHIYSTSYFSFLQNKENNNLDSLKDGVWRIFLDGGCELHYSIDISCLFLRIDS